MTKTVRILKSQIGWILGAGLVLIYASASRAEPVYVDIHQGYRYLAPKKPSAAETTTEEIVELAPAKPIQFKPAPKNITTTAKTAQETVIPGPTDFFFGKASINNTSKDLNLKPEEETSSPSASTAPPVVSAPKATVAPSVSKPTAPLAPQLATAPTLIPQMPEFLGSPIWGRSKERDRWSRTVLEVVRANKKTLDRARDTERFCPGYKNSSQRAQEMCWLIVLSAMTKFESNFNPNTSLVESNGDVSVGLLAMSGHQCRNAPTIRALKNPIENLKCGTRKMVSLVDDDHFISAGKSGGAANWSVLRNPYYANVHGRMVKVGKISQILALTKPAFKNTLKADASYQQKLRMAQERETAPVPAPNTTTTPAQKGRS